MKKIVVKVPMSGEKGKPRIFQAVSKLEGIKSIVVDADKSTLTVVGDVDPVCIISALRKKNMCAEIESVGEDKKEESKEEKKEKECKELYKKIEECYPLWVRPPVPYYGNTVCYEEPQYGCNIM